MTLELPKGSISIGIYIYIYISWRFSLFFPLGFKEFYLVYRNTLVFSHRVFPKLQDDNRWTSKQCLQEDNWSRGSVRIN